MNYPFKKNSSFPDDYAATSKPVREPEKKSRWGWKVSLIILFISALAWSWIKINNPQTFPIRKVSINGNYTDVDHQTLEQVISPFLINGMLGVDLNQLKNNLLNIPWVASVTVTRVWPDKLVINLTQEIPIAHWNNTVLLNSHGDIFNPGNHPAANNLPWLYGPDNQQNNLWTAYQEINQQLASLNLFAHSVEMTPRGAWQVELNNGMLLILGRDDGISRLQRFVSVYPKVFAGHTNDVEYVDLRYANGLAVKWKTNSATTITATTKAK